MYDQIKGTYRIFNLQPHKKECTECKNIKLYKLENDSLLLIKFSTGQFEIMAFAKGVDQSDADAGDGMILNTNSDFIGDFKLTMWIPSELGI